MRFSSHKSILAAGIVSTYALELQPGAQLTSRSDWHRDNEHAHSHWLADSRGIGNRLTDDEQDIVEKIALHVGMHTQGSTTWPHNTAFDKRGQIYYGPTPWRKWPTTRQATTCASCNRGFGVWSKMFGVRVSQSHCRYCGQVTHSSCTRTAGETVSGKGDHFPTIRMCGQCRNMVNGLVSGVSILHERDDETMGQYERLKPWMDLEFQYVVRLSKFACFNVRDTPLMRSVGADPTCQREVCRKHMQARTKVAGADYSYIDLAIDLERQNWNRKDSQGNCLFRGQGFALLNMLTSVDYFYYCPHIGSSPNVVLNKIKNDIIDKVTAQSWESSETRMLWLDVKNIYDNMAKFIYDPNNVPSFDFYQLVIIIGGARFDALHRGRRLRQHEVSPDLFAQEMSASRHNFKHCVEGRLAEFFTKFELTNWESERGWRNDHTFALSKTNKWKARAVWGALGTVFIVVVVVVGGLALMAIGGGGGGGGGSHGHSGGGGGGLSHGRGGGGGGGGGGGPSVASHNHGGGGDAGGVPVHHHGDTAAGTSNVHHNGGGGYSVPSHDTDGGQGGDIFIAGVLPVDGDPCMISSGSSAPLFDDQVKKLRVQIKQEVVDDFEKCAEQLRRAGFQMQQECREKHARDRAAVPAEIDYPVP